MALASRNVSSLFSFGATARIRLTRQSRSVHPQLLPVQEQTLRCLLFAYACADLCQLFLPQPLKPRTGDTRVRNRVLRVTVTKVVLYRAQILAFVGKIVAA